MKQLQRSFLKSYSSVMLCNERSIAINKVQWPPDFSVRNSLLGSMLQLPFGFLLATRIPWGNFLDVCNAV